MKFYFCRVNVYENKILALFEENDHPVFNTTLKASVRDLKPHYVQMFEEIAADLSCQNMNELLSVSVERELIEFEECNLIIDESIHYNRFRANTLGADVYRDEALKWKPLDYKRYCRKYEGEALKGGIKEGCWSNVEADKLFGGSDEPGEFYSLGSSGWKLTAVKDALIDLYCLSKGLNLIRFSMYNSLLFKGKLEQYGKILLYGSDEQQTLCLKVMERAIKA